MTTILARWRVFAGIILAGLAAWPACAADEVVKAAPVTGIDSGDVAWMLVASALIIRLPETGDTCHAWRTPVFEPRHALRSMVRIWWYVLRPGHAHAEIGAAE